MADENENLTLEQYGPNGWLHFTPAGRALVDPLAFQSAVEFAVYGEHGGGRVTFMWNDAGEIKTSLSPEDGRESLRRFAAGSSAIMKALSEGKLRAFVYDQSGRLLQVDEMYWWRAKVDDRSRLRLGVGVPDDLVGAVALVDREQLPDWRKVAEAAASAVAEPNIGDERAVVVATAAGLKACGVWLRERFEDEETKGWAKPRFRSLALSKFQGRLSGRGFDGVWSEVVADYPERTRAGAKPKL